MSTSDGGGSGVGGSSVPPVGSDGPATEDVRRTLRAQVDREPAQWPTARAVLRESLERLERGTPEERAAEVRAIWLWAALRG